MWFEFFRSCDMVWDSHVNGFGVQLREGAGPVPKGSIVVHGHAEPDDNDPHSLVKAVGKARASLLGPLALLNASCSGSSGNGPRCKAKNMEFRDVKGKGGLQDEHGSVMQCYSGRATRGIKEGE